MRIVIVGAGVAGCIMARTLARVPGSRGDVSRARRAGRSFGIRHGPQYRAECCAGAASPRRHALCDAITDASLPWRNWKISLMDGTALFDLPLSKVANNDGWRIRWSELYRVLRSAAPGIAYGCDDHACRPRPKQSRKDFCRMARKTESAHRLDNIDLLIATDGRYSHMRRIFSGEPGLKHVGVAISRVIVPDTSRGLVDDYEQWFNGPNRLARVPRAAGLHLYRLRVSHRAGTTHSGTSQAGRRAA